MELRDFDTVSYDTLFNDQPEQIENYILHELDRLYMQELNKSDVTNDKDMDQRFEYFQNKVLSSNTFNVMIGRIIEDFDKLRKQVKDSNFNNRIINDGLDVEDLD